jgi:2'-5' RNA ligase
MNNNNAKRLFIALNLPADAKKNIAAVINKLAAADKNVKWVASDNCHLTLHFLGNLNNSAIEKVQKTIQSFDNKFNSFNFKAVRISAWPNHNQPRIIFLECKPISSNSVFKLQELLGKKLSELGIDIDKRIWQPHITIGRVKDSSLFKLPDNTAIDEFSFSVGTFDLMESQLAPAGPIYKVIEKYNLNKNI